MSAVARRWLCSVGCRSRWYVRRSAVFRPIPGRRASSVARSSIADTIGNRERDDGSEEAQSRRLSPVPFSDFAASSASERQLERQVHATGKLAHFLLGQVSRLLLRLDDRNEDEILEHLDVGSVHDRRVDLDLPDLALSVGLDRDHSASRGGVHRPRFEIVLNLLQPTLHLLRLLQDLHDVSHCYRGASEEAEKLPGARRAPQAHAPPSVAAFGGNLDLMRWKNQSSNSRSSASIAAPRTGSRFLSDAMR